MTFAFQRACAGIVAATCLSLSLAGAPAHAQRAGTEAGARQDALRQVAPGLERYRQDVLQGNLWQRPDLSPRDRSVVTVAARHGPLGLALLPIGAYEPRWFMADQHMNPADAVRGFGLLGARQALGFHWGTFRLTDEGVEQPLADLGAALADEGVDSARFIAARPGQVWPHGAAV